MVIYIVDVFSPATETYSKVNSFICYTSSFLSHRFAMAERKLIYFVAFLYASNMSCTDSYNVTSKFDSTSPNSFLITTTQTAMLNITVYANESSTTFQFFVKGLYVMDCQNRILNYLASIKAPISPYFSTINCACYGLCLPSMAPNPEAYAAYLSYQDYQRQIQLQNNLKQYSPFGAVTIAIFVIGITGNLMTLVSIIMWLPRNVTNICLASQSISDILIVSYSPALRLMKMVYNLWLSGNIGCILAYAVRDTTFMASSMTLALLGTERFIAICYPLKAKRISSSKKTIKMLACVWAGSFAIGVWRGFNVFYQPSGPFCYFVMTPSTQGRAFFIIRFVGIFLLPMLLLIFCYSRVCITLFKSLAQVRKLKNSRSLEAASKAKAGRKGEEIAGSKTTEDVEKKQKEITGRIKVIRLLISIMITFFICWGPIICLETITGIIGIFTTVDTSMIEIFYTLSYANSAINPILYGIFSSPIRICYTRILCCQKCRGKKLTLPGESSQAIKTTKRYPSQVKSDIKKPTSITHAA